MHCLVLDAVIDGSGAVRIEHSKSLDAIEPETYRILSGHSIGEVTLVGSEPVWTEQADAISEDPRVFVYAALSTNVAAGLQPECQVGIGPDEASVPPAGGGWRYIGLESVLGRPAHHVACAGDLWIDVATRLVLRNRAPVLDDALQPIDGEFRTIEVTELEFGDQPAALFDLSRPDGIAAITPEQECARDPSCSATPAPAFTPRPDATPGAYQPTAAEPRLERLGGVCHPARGLQRWACRHLPGAGGRRTTPDRRR